MHRTPIARLCTAFVLLTALLLLPTRAQAQSDGQVLNCLQKSVSVMVPGDPATYQVAGHLCANGSWQGKTIQLLVPGGTYAQYYWDLPNQPDYSYVRWATSQGFATFNIDRLGTGQSDKPPAAELGTTTSADVLHQVVQALKNGQVVPYAFSTVLLVGHSYGSMVSLVETANYHDTAGVVVTGFLHTPNTAALAQVNGALTPASPPGYITTKPGTRGGIFYNQMFADPRVIATDEQLKSVDSGASLSDTSVAFDPATSRRITVPVLVMVGQQDLLFCDTTTPGLACNSPADIMARESSAYVPAACLETAVQPASGHSIALHPANHFGYAVTTNWASRRIGVDSTHPATQPCTATP